MITPDECLARVAALRARIAANATPPPLAEAPEAIERGDLAAAIPPATPNPKAHRQRAKNRGGRPLGWLKPETAFALGVAVGRGRCWTDVAKAAGVGKSTLYRWYRLGESGDARFAPLATALKAARESEAFWSVTRRSYGSIFRTVETPGLGTEGPAECVERMRENDGDAPETDALGRGTL